MLDKAACSGRIKTAIFHIIQNNTMEGACSMRRITVAANAKINLTLDILGRRPDGMHEVEMVMQSAGWCDEITVERAPGGQIRLTVESVSPAQDKPEAEGLPQAAFVPLDHRNTAVQAAQAFFDAAGLSCEGLSIRIVKRIPVAAGLAGGSADAAGVLTALDALFETRLGAKGLFDAARRIGADVPFCLAGGTMLARGTGTGLSPLPPLPPCVLVIAKPEASVSTAGAYARFDAAHNVCRPDTGAMLAALQNADLPGVAAHLGNVFEDASACGPAAEETVRKIKRVMAGAGALGAAMSGSGPSVFGIFTERAAAEVCCADLLRFCPQAAVCMPVRRGCELRAAE